MSTSIDDVRTIEINEDVFLNTCKDICLAINKGKIMFMEVGLHQDIMQMSIQE